MEVARRSTSRTPVEGQRDSSSLRENFPASWPDSKQKAQSHDTRRRGGSRSPQTVRTSCSTVSARSDHDPRRRRGATPTEEHTRPEGTATAELPAGRLSFYCFVEIIFLSSGLKYQDTTVKIVSNTDGKISPTESPTAMCEKKAPDIVKKKPA